MIKTNSSVEAEKTKLLTINHHILLIMIMNGSMVQLFVVSILYVVPYLLITFNALKKTPAKICQRLDTVEW